MPANKLDNISGKMFVRLRPYDKRRGHLLRSYTFQGIKFDESKGWYTVDAGLAELLKEVPQRAEDEMSVAAFDVCTYDEAVARDEYEEQAAKRAYERALAQNARSVDRRGATSAHDAARRLGVVTSEDLPSTPKQRADLGAAPVSRYAEQAAIADNGTLTTRDIRYQDGGETSGDGGGPDVNPADDDAAFADVGAGNVDASKAPTGVGAPPPPTVPRAARRAPARKPNVAPMPKATTDE